jgi:diguanylate cyclase (GGDEF)-like protein/PAS domain S-box-containing protein
MSDRPQIEFTLISRSVLDALPLGLLLLDDQGVVVWANTWWSVFTAGDVNASTPVGLGDRYAEVAPVRLSLHPDVAQQIDQGIREVREENRDRFSLDCSVRLAGDDRRLFIVIMSIDVSEQRLVLVVHQDVTERMDRQESLELFRDAIEQADDFILIADRDGAIEHVNDSFRQRTGLTDGEASGRSIWARSEDDRDPALVEAILEVLRSGSSWREEIRVEAVNGEVRWESQIVSPIRDIHGGLSHMLVVGRDVTEQHTYIDELRRQAYYDGLTGLPNRALFVDRLIHAHTRVQRSRQPLAVMFLDLNGFKRVNDRFGHSTGDQVLAQVAGRLSDSLRATDTVARSGGDEFIFLLEEVESDSDAFTVARRIVDEISRPIEIDQEHISVSGSIGIAFNTPAIVDPLGLLDLADVALYHAKARSDDQFVIYRENMTMPESDRRNPDTPQT